LSTSFAEKLSDKIESAVNDTGRNAVSVEAVEAMAGDIGHHHVRLFSDHGKRFIAFMFSADESELVISAEDYITGPTGFRGDPQ
jgi:hypothetical protein